MTVTAQNMLFYLAGIGFLAMAKAKNILTGYSSPKPFDISETEQCAAYDISVVNHWLSYLAKYTNGTVSVNRKNILELGPGSDLGIGLYLLSLGAAQYNACDVNDLVKNTPDAFYNHLFNKFGGLGIKETLISSAKEEHGKFQKRAPSNLNYIVRDDFDLIAAFGKKTTDIVFSQAAFEHFDNIELTFSQLTEVCKPGAILIAEIDLKTHTRWIRDKDPNNIYRYPNWIYNIFRFRGIPNRIRPFQYKRILEDLGWRDVAIFPLKTIDSTPAYSGIHQNFSHEINQMEYLSIMICAKKPLKD